MIAGLHKNDRVLILGAGGWFGQTTINLLPPATSILAIASSQRGNLQTWNDSQIQDFAPTIVLNFAFLTRERVAIEGESKFRAINEELTRHFVHAASLPQVRAALTISSGAAVTEPHLPYGEMKLKEEEQALALISSTRSIVIGRVYSVSGPYVRRPRDYAFSDFILQAQSGSVDITANRPVYRRYVSIEDYLTVCLMQLLSGWSGVIDSGGELVEIGDLARRIVQLVNPTAKIQREKQSTSDIFLYASDDTTWVDACSMLDFTAERLENQICQTASWLLG